MTGRARARAGTRSCRNAHLPPLRRPAGKETVLAAPRPAAMSAERRLVAPERAFAHIRDIAA
jgi:hypothetical protein